MTNSREVTLIIDDEPVLCVVTYDLEGADQFADGVMYCIRRDKNIDIVDSLTDEQFEEIENQLTQQFKPFGGDPDDGAYPDPEL